MRKNQIFVPRAVLDAWVAKRRVAVAENQLVLDGGRTRLALTEAVRVIAEVSGQSDVHGLLGRVIAVEDAKKLTAEVVEGSMLVADRAYEVVPGFVCSPIGVAGTLRPTEEVLEGIISAAEALENEPTDEELLAQYLIRNLE